MESVDSGKRVTRSQLPLPDTTLHLSRSPLKDARIAQRNYPMQLQDPPPDDPDTDDEILLSPNKTRRLNSRVNPIVKRSASPPPHDNYRDATPGDGRAFKRIKCDTEESEIRTAVRAPEEEGSDIENTDTNIRTTAPSAPTHGRNLSEPAIGSARTSSKPRSASRNTPASPKGKGRARSVPVFPVLDLSTVTPWRRRARSRSPSKERDSPKLKVTFTSLSSIPDEAAMPPPVAPPSAPPMPDVIPAPEPPTLPPPAVFKPPVTPVVPKHHGVFATPMSPLTPLPETPRPFQIRSDTQDDYPRTIGWGTDFEEVQRIHGLPVASSDTSSVFPFITPASSSAQAADHPSAVEPVEPSISLEDTQPRDTAVASRSTAKGPAHSFLPRPSSQSIMGPPPFPASKTSELDEKDRKVSSKLVAPPLFPVENSSASTSTSAAPKNAFSIMMASSARGTATKGKGKEKRKEKISKTTALHSTASLKVPSYSSSTSALAGSSKLPSKVPALKEKGKGKGKEKMVEEKVSLKAKMRPREKPKPIPLPILVRLPEESDDERASTPTAESHLETPMTRPVAGFTPTPGDRTEVLSVQSAPRFTSPLTEPESAAPYEDPPMIDGAPPSPLTELSTEGPDDILFMDEGGVLPPVSSSPPAEPEGNLPEPSLLQEHIFVSVGTADRGEGKRPMDVEMPAAVEGEAALSVVSPADLVMGSNVAVEDVAMWPAGSKGHSKARMGKPRVPAPLPAPADRVTRSASLKRKEADKAPTASSFRVRPTTVADGNPAKKQKMDSEMTSHTGPPGSPSKIPMVSPSKTSSFANPTKASAARASATTKSPTKKPVSAAAVPSGGFSSPTKNKLVRASSVFSARPPPSFMRSFTGPDGNTSSLQTLASALEKLRMPPPERPNTSMGFSRDDMDSTLTESTRSADDRSIGLGRPSGGLQRASTVGSIRSASSSASAGDASTPVSSAAPSKPTPIQRPLSLFMGPKATGRSTAKLAVGTGSIMRGGLSVFGPGRGRAAPKVSRNPGLPSVLGSPVKGGDTTLLEENEAENSEGKDETSEKVTSPRGVTFDLASILELDLNKKGKERLPEEWRKNASRRASMALQDLSKSVSLPPKPLGLMGPPETPLNGVGMRSTSSSFPSSSSSDPSGSAGTEYMRRSTRIIAKAAAASDTSVDDAEAEAQHPTETPAVQPLTVLKGCIVFVDIISEVGDDSARSFITDMLKSLGARVLGSVGQTCTHIVYKNGLRSTYTKYKALAEPRPHVVGMEWVVKSAEKRVREEETPYLIDMDDMNTTAVKRRKSMMPRLVPGWMDDSVDGEHSFEGSSSSMIMDDDLTPLERARLRKVAAVAV